VFDAQGGLHVVGLLVGGGKITSRARDGVRKTSLCTSGATGGFESGLTEFRHPSPAMFRLPYTQVTVRTSCKSA